MASRVGDYLLFETLGKGAFGKVKLGVHEETGEQVAVKIMDKSDIKAKEMTMNVRREIAIMKALKHKNIVNLRQVLTSKTKLYIVMDLVTGGELFTKILSEGKLEESVARKCFQQLVDGIEYCHRRGVCHRDLKPENLLIDETTGELKITDFGLSAMKGASTAEELLHTQCGSPNYCAPEIIAKHKEGYNGTKVDAWSCGIILFTLLAGYLPFYDDKTEALYKQIQFSDVKFPRKFPEGARDLVVRLLHKDPDKRYTLNDCKRHPWFLVNYDGDDAPGKQQNNATTLIRRKRRQRRASVDQDPMKVSKVENSGTEPRSKSGNSIQQESEPRSDLSANGDGSRPPQADLPPLPPIIASPARDSAQPRSNVQPAIPLPISGVPEYRSQIPDASGSVPENFASQNTTPVLSDGAVDLAGRHANGRLASVPGDFHPHDSNVYHPSDAPPPYEKVASSGSFAMRYPPPQTFTTVSQTTPPPLPPPAYAPPEYDTPKYGSSSYLEYAPPPPPPDYRPPTDGLRSEVSPLQHSGKANSASGGSGHEIPVTLPLPTLPAMSDVTSIGRGELPALGPDSSASFDTSVLKDAPWIRNGQSEDADVDGVGRERFAGDTSSTMSSLTEARSDASKQVAEKQDSTISESADDRGPQTTFEKRRAMFGSSILAPGNAGSGGAFTASPLPDVTAGPSETLSEGLQSEESLIKMSSSFKALPSLARNFEVLPINFASPDRHARNTADSTLSSLSQEEAGKTLSASAATRESASSSVDQSQSGAFTSMDTILTSEPSYEARGEGMDSSIIEVSIMKMDSNPERNQSESSDSKGQRNLSSSASHEMSSNTVIVHEDDDGNEDEAGREDDCDRVRCQVHRYRKMFALSEDEPLGAVPARQDSGKRFFAEAARISMAWGVVLKRNISEGINVSIVTDEEVEAFRHLLDFWDQYRVQDVQGKEFSSPFAKEKLTLVQNLIEKLASSETEEKSSSRTTDDTTKPDVLSSDVAALTSNPQSNGPEKERGSTDGYSNALKTSPHEDVDIEKPDSKFEPPYQAPHRLEVTPSTVRDPFRPSLKSSEQAYGSVAPSAHLPPVQSTLAANEAAAVVQYGAQIPPNVRVGAGKAQKTTARQKAHPERRSVSNASSRSSEKSDSSREQSVSVKRSSAVVRKAPSDHKDVTVPGKSYFGFRRHGHKKSWPMFQFESKMKPDQCLLVVGRILTGMGGNVMMKRGENKMKYEGQGKMLVSIVCTLNNGLSKMIFKRGKKDKSRTDNKQFLKFFQTVHTRFMKVADGTLPLSPLT